jgi:hypothetical protein
LICMLEDLGSFSGSFSFAPPGLPQYFQPSPHGFRRGLHSSARVSCRKGSCPASRLEWVELRSTESRRRLSPPVSFGEIQIPTCESVLKLKKAISFEIAFLQ